ncbi:MAG: hypothetical protein ABR500_10860 [Dermatophilaceae bacterium]|nr:hypothetical protein [Intrasporangiaceae bacterium]
MNLIVTLRGRSWRHPWPSTISDVELLAVLGAMARMGEPPPRAIAALSVGVPASGDPFAHLDRQQLVAAIDRNNETIRTLRSRLAWTERQYATYKALEKAKNAARRVKRAATQRVLRRKRP